MKNVIKICIMIRVLIETYRNVNMDIDTWSNGKTPY